MIGILNRWRQFGRRYFWPHLLLGMVAASLGVPLNLSGVPDHAALANTSSSQSRQNHGTTNFNSLALLHDIHRRLSFSVDYWQQHALRTVIRHLFCSGTTSGICTRTRSRRNRTGCSIKIQQLALLDTLNALLTHEFKPPAIIRYTEQVERPVLSPYKPGLWLAQVQGIRAGPANLS